MARMKTTLLALVLLAASTADAMDLQGLSGAGPETQLDALLKPKAWTVVMIWSLDCVACERQKPMLSQFHKDHHQGKAQVLGLASDGDQFIQRLDEHMSGSPTDFTNYAPNTDSFYADYLTITGKKFKGTPTYMFFDPKGKLAGVHAGTLHRKQLDQIVSSAGS